jgi:SAM-dependent methyltransferase
MTEARPCPGCLGHESRAFAVVRGIPVRSCRSCATLFTAALPRADEAEDYDGYYHEGNLVLPTFVEGRLGEIASGFDGHRQTNRWLDVGCGAGGFIRAVRSKGWNVTGTEISPQPVERLRLEGFEVLQGDLPALDVPAAAFDVVSMVEVLEHVADPDAQLAACAAALRPGGVLYLTTPHARGLSARLLGERWSVIAPPEHLQLYSAAGLRAATSRASFAVAALRTEAADPSALLAVLPGRRRAAAEEGSSRVTRAYQLNEALTTRRTGALAKRVANAVLNATRLGDALKLIATTPPAGGTPRG